MQPRTWRSFIRFLCLFGVAACSSNRPVTQPLEVTEPIRVGFDTPTRLRALYGGDTVILADVTLLVGRTLRQANDTLYFQVSEYATKGDEKLGAPFVSSVAGATVIVPMATNPRMYVREPGMNTWGPFLAVLGAVALAAGIVALLLNQ